MSSELYIRGSFVKCARAKWELPPAAVAGIWGIMLIVYGVLMNNVNDRANKSLNNSLTLGIFLALATFPIYYISAQLAALWVPVVILNAIDTQSRLTTAGLKVQSNLFTAYIAWLFYILAITGYVAVSCPQIDLSYIPQEIQDSAQIPSEKYLVN
jgi:hypothetical protein